MPRGRGGKRRGRRGSAYSNRTDLNALAKSAPSQSYGEGVEREERLAAVPLPSPRSIAQRPPPPGPPVPGQPTSGVGIDAPTTRPGEPLTAGMSMGAGGGPEGLTIPRQNRPQSVVGFLASLPNSSPELRALARATEVATDSIPLEFEPPDEMLPEEMPAAAQSTAPPTAPPTSSPRAGGPADVASSIPPAGTAPAGPPASPSPSAVPVALPDPEGEESLADEEAV